MNILLYFKHTLVMNAWVVMGNEIPHNERNIDASLVATVYGLTGDYDDRVSYTS